MENEGQSSHIGDIDGQEGNSEKEAHQTQHSQQPEYKNQTEEKLSLEDLKTSPGFEEFEAAVALKDLDEETALLLKGSVRENEEKTSYIDDIDGHESNLEKEAHQTQHSQQPEYKNQSKKKMSLEDLKRTSPPGFEEFETAVALKELDEEIALLLWEDIFKPLSSHFKSLQEEKSLQYTSIYSHCK
ncbi:hypothetical protein ACROYT_G020432 [Oculina patagonica]